MALTLKTSYSNLQVGDYIFCSYTAYTNQLGTFHDIFSGSGVGSAMPSNPADIPDGYFKFICVGTDYMGRKILVADRCIQDNIEAERTNSGRFVYEGEFFLSHPKSIISSSSADKVYTTRVIGNALNGDYRTQEASGNADSIFTTDGLILDSEFVTLNFDSTYSVAGIKFATGDGSNYTARLPSTIKIYDSNDNLLYEDDSLVYNGYQGNDYRNQGYYIFPKSVDITGVKITYTNANSSFVHIAEIDILKRDPNYYFGMRYINSNNSTDFNAVSEWKSLVVNNDLNGNITAGDDSVWNITTSGLTTGFWTQTMEGGNGQRVFTVGTSAGIDTDSLAYTYDNTTTLGYRPVLIVQSLVTNQIDLSGLTCTSNVHKGDATLSGNIVNTVQSQYRIKVNGTYVYPDGVGSYTTLADSPVAVSYVISNASLNFGSNTVTIEVLDAGTNESSKGFTVSKTNANPTDDIIADRTTYHAESVVLSGNITDADGDDIRYRVLMDGGEVQAWSSLTAGPIAVNYTFTAAAMGYQSRTLRVEYEDDFGGSGFFEQAVTYSNTNPVIDLTYNSLGVYQNNFTLTGNITEADGDTVRYKIEIGGTPIVDWTSYQATPLAINESIAYTNFNLGSNTLSFFVEDGVGGTAQTDYTVVRRDWEITYTDSANPTTNYFNDTVVNLSTTQTILVRTGDIDNNLGYPDTTELTLAMQVQATGNVKIAKLLSEWNPLTVTDNTKPSIDLATEQTISFTDTPTQVIDVSLLANPYGVALYTDLGSFQVDYLGNSSEITYKETVLYQPTVVYHDKTTLVWGSPIFTDPTVKSSAFFRLVLERAEISDFSDASAIFQTLDMNENSFEDSTITTSKTYYYRLKMQFRDIDDAGNKWDFDQADEGLYIEEDSAKTVFTVGGQASLYGATSQTLTEDFADDTGFTYNPTDIEFVGGKVQLKSTI